MRKHRLGQMGHLYAHPALPPGLQLWAFPEAGSQLCVFVPFPPAPKEPSVLHLHVYLSFPFLRMGSESVGGGERKLKGW